MHDEDEVEVCGALMACHRAKGHRGQHGGWRPLRGVHISVTPLVPPHPDALWQDPAPETPEGRRLWGMLGLGRDVGQRICQIEAEARTGVKA